MTLIEPKTARELAEMIGGELIGEGAALVCDVANLEEAGEESLSWVGSTKHLRRALGSQASVILIPLDCDPPSDKTVVRVSDPEGSLCDILVALGPRIPAIPIGVDANAEIQEGAVVEGAAIGPRVFVGARAVVGAGTQLFPGVYVGPDARIGRDCVIWPNVVIRERVVVGDRVIIHPNVTIGADGFGYLQRNGVHRKIPQIGTVIIEDDVEIGANSTIDRARTGATRIGRGTKLDNQVLIAHNCRIGEQCILTGHCAVAGSSTLGAYVVMGGKAAVSDHVHVGDRVMVAGCSVAFADVEAGRIVRGVPAVEHQAFSRQHVALQKLPELLRTVKALERRLARLEQRENDAWQS